MVRTGLAAALVNSVEFDQTDTGSVVVAPQNCSPVSLDQRRENGRFAIVPRREPGRLNGRLLGILPIIVSDKKVAIAVV